MRSLRTNKQKTLADSQTEGGARVMTKGVRDSVLEKAAECSLGFRFERGYAMPIKSFSDGIAEKVNLFFLS